MYTYSPQTKKYFLPTIKHRLNQAKRIRHHWDEKQEKRYFSVVDIVGVLSESKDPKTYRKVLKTRLKTEGNEMVTNCNQLKMLAQDGYKL